ncbi:hypothetical protein MBLNU459_g0824t1 [Dothideomycetes sp. NU459]
MATPTASEQEQKDAQEYWGYLFNADRTGTDKLKNLLRGLHAIISTAFEPYDSSDLTPAQIAHFYRAVNGNYDQLFLSSPATTIAFIYKNLGCLHSLQPLPSASTAPRFSDPVIPALKVEGWIMWQTIQLLLGPEEHSAFLREAVQKWDVKDPETGDAFPKILPRSCFPPAPDSHMVNWYEGVSDRLRREAEEEEKKRIAAPEDDRPDTPNDSTIKHRRRLTRHAHESEAEDSSPDSKGFAIAYFRNPLFRTVDGRPGVVRRGSRRPPMSQQNSSSFVQRGKVVASTVGNVVKNVGSPHLWDGHTTKEKDRDRRRRSLPDKHRFEDDGHDSARNSPPGLHPHYHERRRRRDSDSPDSDRSWEASPRRSPVSHHHGHQSHHSDSAIRHRKNHDAEPAQREYFPAYDGDTSRRSSATFPDPRSDSPSQAGFIPSQSPLFATQVGRSDLPAGYRQQSRPRPPVQKANDYAGPQRSSSLRYPGRDERPATGSDPGSGRYGQRSKQTRFEERPPPPPVDGVGGRKYANEAAWR